MGQKDIFRQFLLARFGDGADALLRRFERYHSWLVDENLKINLISRQTDPEDIWTVHFLDSLLSTKYADFRGKKVLDFGTGGGLPGIPLALAFGDAAFTLLDSRKKKIAAVRNAAAFLGLDNCRFRDQRLEEVGGDDAFDIIVSRSVKIEPEYGPILLKHLKPRGKIVLYKSRILDDVRVFGGDGVDIFDAGTPELGERKIVVITR
jgi:16S rRNA (guanine527-N7)-methyltransferase